MKIILFTLILFDSWDWIWQLSAVIIIPALVCVGFDVWKERKENRKNKRLK